jgi:HEPN domain-containing protein
MLDDPEFRPARYPDAVPGAAPAQRYTAAEADDAVAHAERVLGAVDDVWDQLTRAGGT